MCCAPGRKCRRRIDCPEFPRGDHKTHMLIWRKRDIPYAFIDFNIEQTHALCYIGQDSKTSGYIAAKILMRSYKGQELVLFLNNQKNSPAEIQMQRRLEGFMQYLSEEHKNLIIHDIVLHKEDTDGNRGSGGCFF